MRGAAKKVKRRSAQKRAARIFERLWHKNFFAAVYAPNSKYKVFWSLILAAPDDRRT